MYINKLNDIVNAYNNTYHRTINMRPAALKIMHVLILVNRLMIKILNSKLVIKVGVRISKNIFAKVHTPSWSEEVFVIKEVTNTLPWTYVISDLNDETLLEYFMKKNCKIQVKSNYR